MAKGKTATQQAPESEAVSSLSTMRLRGYPTARQSRRLATWLSVSHGFRNEAVAWLAVRRRARGKWFAQHKGLPPEQVKAKLPPHLAGSDCTALSQWLTSELEKARVFAVREFGLVCGKTQLGETFTAAWGGCRAVKNKRCANVVTTLGFTSTGC